MRTDSIPVSLDIAKFYRVMIYGDYPFPAILCDILWNQLQIKRDQSVRFLDNLCNSTIIEIYSDIIQVSHGFKGCQMLEYIAESTNSIFLKKTV